MELPVYDLKISDIVTDEAEVSYVALVDKPAIQRDFLAFNDAEKLKVREFKKEQSRIESNQRKRAKKAAETVEISFKTKKKFPSK